MACSSAFYLNLYLAHSIHSPCHECSIAIHTLSLSFPSKSIISFLMILLSSTLMGMLISLKSSTLHLIRLAITYLYLTITFLNLCFYLVSISCLICGINLSSILYISARILARIFSNTLLLLATNF